MIDRLFRFRIPDFLKKPGAEEPEGTDLRADPNPSVTDPDAAGQRKRPGSSADCSAEERTEREGRTPGAELSAGLLEKRMRQSLLNRLRDGEDPDDEQLYAMIDGMILEQSRTRRMPLREKEALRSTLFHSIRGLDILDELVEDDSVTEIMINGCDDIFLERSGVVTKWEKRFPSRERLDDVIRKIAGSCNRIVNEQHPIADARLPDGSRVNVVLPPVSIDGPAVTIRKFPEEGVTMEKLLRWGSLTPEAAEFLRRLVRAGYSILVGGGTSSGKTTFLNALSHFIPPDQRVITIEDNAELQIRGISNLVRLEARSSGLEGKFEVTMRDLVKTALRMRPSRIIIGEVRGAEAGDWLTCLNTGHEGSLGTAHANSVRDMIGRLETMVLMGIDIPVPVIRSQIASGIEILVHLKRDARGRRKLYEIAEILGMEGDEIRMHTLFRRNEAGELLREEPLVHTEKLRLSENLYETE